MSLWKKPFDPTYFPVPNNMCTHIGMEFTEQGENFLRGTLPVDHRTVQPFGLLHGGANVVLAESLASFAGYLACDEGCFCVGIEINANHLRAVTSGVVTGTAKPVHIGKKTQVWEIRIEDDKGQLSCISRMTLAVKQIPQG